MPNLASHVGRTRQSIARLIDAYRDVTSSITEYTALGGQTAVHPFFVTTTKNADGTTTETPRNDLDITEQQYVDAIASLATIGALISQGHDTNLYRVRG